MAGSFSDYLEAKVLDHVLGNTAYTAPATVYLALFTVAPTDAGGGTECTGGSYVRKAVTNNTTNFPNASGTSPTTKNLHVAQSFVTATADWGLVVAVGVFDASSAGNLLAWADLSDTKTIDAADTATFEADTLVFTLV